MEEVSLAEKMIWILHPKDHKSQVGEWEKYGYSIGLGVKDGDTIRFESKLFKRGNCSGFVKSLNIKKGKVFCNITSLKHKHINTVLLNNEDKLVDGLFCGGVKAIFEIKEIVRIQLKKNPSRLKIMSKTLSNVFMYPRLVLIEKYLGFD